jgi:pyrimidine operon attenuation protein/uracil phosphoribosyltransferase
MDYGRPSKIELAVLVDRGHREIPIQPDYVGEAVETRFEQYVKVRFQEDDQKEGVFLVTARHETENE